MLKSSNTGTVAQCNKCGLKHQRPVGVRCRRNLNVSAPLLMEVHDEQPEQQSSIVAEQPKAAVASVSEGPANVNSSKASQVESKLDLILQKVQDLENKNIQLEQKLHDQQAPAIRAAGPVHSSPKRPYSNSRRGTSKGGHARQSRKLVRVEESSDEEWSDMSSPQASSTQTSHFNDTSASQPSLQLLKEDERTQQKVQRQLEKLQGQARGSRIAGKKIKSGLLRSGDNEVKTEIAWPHHHCFPSAGGNLPEYRELSPLQFLVGFMGCVLEENSNTIRTKMLEYGRHLLQDAIETNWATARHAHLVLLQDIERGKCSWRRPDAVEKIRIRYTARIITQKASVNTAKTAKITTKDKICLDYNANGCKFASDHVFDGQITKHACSHCFKKVGKFYYHKIQDCIQRHSAETNKEGAKHS